MVVAESASSGVQPHLDQIDDLVEIVAVLGIWHARIGSHRKLHAGLMSALEAGDVLVDGGLGLANHVRANAGARAVLHHVADSGRGRDEIGAAIEHELDAFVVEEIAMLDGIDAGLDRVLDRGRAMRVGAGDLSGRVGLFDRGTHFFDGELRRTDLAAGAQDAAAGDQLHIVGAQLDLRSRRATHGVGPIGLVTELPAVPSGHADDQAAEHKARRRTQALLRCGPQGEIDAAAGTAIADRGDAAFQGAAGVARGPQQGNRIGIAGLLGARIGQAVAAQMHVTIDESRKNGLRRQILASDGLSQ